MNNTRSGICHSSRCAPLILLLATLALPLAAGCSANKANVCDLQYCDDISGVSHYRGYGSTIEYPCLDFPTPYSVSVSDEPRSLARRVDDEPRDFTLQEAIQTALANNEVIESGGSGAKASLRGAGGVSTVYDPGIQQSGVLFGRGRGVEAALADFDTTFNTSMLWGRSRTSNVGAGRETGVFTSGLSKRFASGSTLSLDHNWYYLTPSPATSGPWPSAYSGNIGASYRHPLLAASGVEFTRIAGPVNRAFGPITGVSQGVLIARISADITLADFEAAVRNATLDVEYAYWDMYLAYRNYDTSVAAHRSAFTTWRKSQDRFEVGLGDPEEELQSRDQLYQTKSSVETSLNSLYKAEIEVRRLVGLPMNDGTVLRPIDEPAVAEFIPDWRGSLTEGLTHRVELRRQKWAIKSLQLQLKAARSLVKPRLDFVTSYDVNGVGDSLITQSGGGSGFGSLTHDHLESWTMGLEMSVPLGFRLARSQVRNLELQLTRDIAILASQERNIAHDIATAIQDVTSGYAAAQSNRKRLEAAAKRIPKVRDKVRFGTATVDMLLRAQSSLADAENAYYQQLVAYNKAIAALSLANGTSLDSYGVSLAEGPWCPAAYGDAMLRANARTHAKDAPNLVTEPAEFVSPGPTGAVDLYPARPSFSDMETMLPPLTEDKAAAAAVPGVPSVDDR
ncbi:MAG: TolC family protein [Fuerstiella sp.]|nr:TolC family protein [Fuerstiella sp.]